MERRPHHGQRTLTPFAVLPFANGACSPAATWEPTLSGNLLVFGLIVSAGGGLAAPLFVALLGWGLAQRDLTMQQRWWRAGCLFGCQGIVNVSSPHLFELFTPGVLSLLGVLILTEPWWGRGLRTSNKPTVVFSWLFGLTVLFCFVFTSWQGRSSWTYRVDTASVLTWFEHVVFTGLYQSFPGSCSHPLAQPLPCFPHPNATPSFELCR